MTQVAPLALKAICGKEQLKRWVFWRFPETNKAYHGAEVTFCGWVFHNQRPENVSRRWLKDGCVMK